MGSFIFLFVFLAVLLLAAFFMKELQNVQSYKVNSWSENHHGDCAVVLTGGAGRIKEGIDLLSTRAVQKLIISGVFKHTDLRDLFSEVPYYGSLREEDILLDKFSKTTFSNALETMTLVEGLHCRDLILITSQVHMYRAYKTFKSVFPKNFPIIQRTVVGSDFTPKKLDIMEEAAKSLFYSMWAY